MVDGRESLTVVAIARSLHEKFPYVRVFQSFEGWGYHFLCSLQPIILPAPDVFASRLPLKAKTDFIEWREDRDPQSFYQAVIDGEIPIETLLSMKEDVRITDDRPYNEYFLLRRIWNKSQ